tara:strand:+ start:5938 stop:7527 length:1590 start_codon:yes stop_codon:yes gene_type:complete
MKWVGQQIYDFVSRFRNDVYFENIENGASDTDKFLIIGSSGKLKYRTGNQLLTDIGAGSGTVSEVVAGTALSGGGEEGSVTLNVSGLTVSEIAAGSLTVSSESFADNDTTLMTSAAINDRIESFGYGTGDITGVRLTADDSNVASITSGSADFTIAGGTGVRTTVSGTTVTAGLNISDITSLTALTTIGAASATTNIAAGDLTMYNAVNNGNPTISLGSSATERLEIKAEYESGAQGLDVVKFITHTAGGSSDDARYAFQVDETFIFNILDGGVRIKASGQLEMGSGNTILSDSSGTTTLSNIDAIDATTESTIETAIDTLSNLTTVGTIGTGVWQGTAIASAYLDADTAHLSGDQTFTGEKTFNTAIATGSTKHLIHYDFQGYGTGDGVNYEVSKNVATNTAPFNHDNSTGSDGLDAMTVQTWARLGGKVMPRACTLKRVTGWSTASGSATADIGLFKVSPVRNNNSNRSAELLVNMSYTAMGNAKMEDHDVTSFTESGLTAGDILFTAIKSESGASQYFSLTVEVEF